MRATARVVVLDQSMRRYSLRTCPGRNKRHGAGTEQLTGAGLFRPLAAWLGGPALGRLH